MFKKLGIASKFIIRWMVYLLIIVGPPLVVWAISASPTLSWSPILNTNLGSGSLPSILTPSVMPEPSATPPSTSKISVPRSNEIELTVYPVLGAVGWATSLDGRSYMVEPEIRVGTFEGQTYLGALQFDLSAVPDWATVTEAHLELTGLDAQRTKPGGKWELQLLEPAINTSWPKLNYNKLRRTTSQINIGATLASSDLKTNQVNTFHFGAEQLVVLQSHLVNDVVSFRIKGPRGANDNLFSWNGGDNEDTKVAASPVLYLHLIIPHDQDKTLVANSSVEATATPFPFSKSTDTVPPRTTTEPATATPLSPEDMIIITSTPMPENIITVAALAATATEVATTVGTYTPAPQMGVTPIIVTPQPTPANTATAEYLEAAATADAFLYGDPTSTPPNLWTTTPIKPTSTSTTTPDPKAITPVIVTSTPTPENVVTIAAQAQAATAIATAVGTYTPVPKSWVQPIVVTPQPPQAAPANAATAAFRVIEATAQAFVNGTATPTPIYVWTATPTPFLVPVIGEVATPWVAVSPTPTPPPIPQKLVGKIAFLSNRSGGPQPLRHPLVYIIDPDGNNLAVLADDTFYKMAIARDYYSSDQRFRTFVKDFPRYYGSNGKHEMVPAIFYYDYEYNVEEQITFFGAGEAWDPVWSPTQEQMAFVSNDSQDDEIWIVNRDGSGTQRLTETNEAFNAREIGKDTFIPEVNGQPSWSPDGSQIVFWSNRTGHRQIWVMNVDGSNLYSLSTTGYDDWNPVWIKYTDPARNPVPGQ